MAGYRGPNVSLLPTFRRLTCSPNKRAELAKAYPLFIRAICKREGEDSLPYSALTIWQALWPDDLNLLSIIVQHIDPIDLTRLRDKRLLHRLFNIYKNSDKRKKAGASRAIAHIGITSFRHPDPTQIALLFDIIMTDMRAAIKSTLPIQASVISIIGAMGRDAPEEQFGEILEMLMMQLGKGHITTQALAYSEVSCSVPRHCQVLSFS